MGKPFGTGPFFAMALAGLLVSAHAGVAPGDEAPGGEGHFGQSPIGKGNLLVLHYRWKHDTLSLVGSERIQAALKPSRSRSKGDAGESGFRDDAPRSPFSFEVVSGTGATLRTKFLPDPGTKRVEYQEKGESRMRQETVALDSSDIFVEVPETEAKTIRFYRHGRIGPAAKRSGSGSASGTGSVQSGPSQFGPEPSLSKTLLGEFPLE
jgi:hypothetical protein